MNSPRVETASDPAATVTESFATIHFLPLKYTGLYSLKLCRSIGESFTSTDTLCLVFPNHSANALWYLSQRAAGVMDRASNEDTNETWD